MGVLVASISAWPTAAHIAAAHARTLTTDAPNVEPVSVSNDENATELLTGIAQAEWQAAVESTNAASSNQHGFHWPSSTDTVAYDTAVVQWDRLQRATDNAIEWEALKHDAYKRTSGGFARQLRVSFAHVD